MEKDEAAGERTDRKRKKKKVMMRSKQEERISEGIAQTNALAIANG